jgi:hypothetical protein
VICLTIQGDTTVIMSLHPPVYALNCFGSRCRIAARAWRTDSRRAEQWRARHHQKLQAEGEGVGVADMADLPLLTEAVGEVIKLRLVEWWQKSISRYRSKQRATPDERREDGKRRRKFMSRILEEDSSAEARAVNVDLDAVSEAETLDVFILVMKRVLKEEVPAIT